MPEYCSPPHLPCPHDCNTIAPLLGSSPIWTEVVTWLCTRYSFTVESTKGGSQSLHGREFLRWAPSPFGVTVSFTSELGVYPVFTPKPPFSPILDSTVRGFRARILPPPTCFAHTFTMLLHDYCAIYDRPPDAPFVCHTHYNIGNGNIVYRPSRGLRTSTLKWGHGHTSGGP